MLVNYFKVAFRNLLRQKEYSIINILGLTIGIAAFIMIMLYVQYELGFDKNIPNNENIYRCVELQYPEGIDDQHVAVTMSPLGQTLVENFPEITDMVRLWFVWKMPIMTAKGEVINQDFVSFADSNVFNMFGVKLISGDEKTALVNPKNIVLSERAAKKIFGSIDNAMNQIITIFGYEGFKVSGIMENSPKTTHFPFEALISMTTGENLFPWWDSWGSNSLATYVKLQDNVDYKKLNKKLKPFLLKYREIPDDEQERFFDLYLQPLKEIHLKSSHIKFQVLNFNQGNINTVYIFSIIALLIIIIACVNYINIAIARSMKQAREVGMRKVMGATKRSLIYRFLSESFILTFISVVLSILLVELLLPFFSDILNIELQIDLINNWMLNIGLLVLLFIISLMSGAYPAFYLTRFRPIKVLKGNLGESEMKSGIMSKILVVFQFIVSIALIFSIIALNKQINFVLNKDLGYNPNNVYNISLQNNNDSDDLKQLKENLLQNPNIVGAAVCSNYNGVAGTQGGVMVDDTANTALMMRYGYVDYNFFDVMEMQIIAGRNFSKSYSLDKENSVIINEATANTLGWENPLDKVFEPFYMDTLHKRKVIGVVKDYHYFSLRTKIEPAVYFIYPEEFRNLVVRVKNTENITQYIEESWQKIFPGKPLEMNLVNEILEKNYRGERRMMELFGYFTILSLIICSLGLYGLTSLLIQQKRKEIGIRKVLGSPVSHLVFLLAKNFLILVIVAAAISLPLAWYFMNDLINGFAYRTEISWYIYVIALLSTLIIAMLTIIYHTYKAANSNPIDSIKCE